jgi:glycosyltransferase involved in cell wall biosynthesis
MNVLHVIPTIDLEKGGPSHGVRMMAEACAARGLQVEVAATSYGTSRGTADPGRLWEYQEGGVIYRLFPQVRGSRWNLSLPLTRWLLAQAGRYDVLHVHAPFSYPTLAACGAARRRGAPYIYRTMGTLDPWSLRHRAWKKWPYYHLVEKRNLRAAAVVHVMSQAELRAIRQLGFGAHARVVGYGIALPEISRRGPRDVVRFLFLGRLHPIKALPTLLEAIATLAAGDGAAVRLDVAGGGDEAYRRELEGQVERLSVGAHVRFHGFVHGEAKLRLFAESDAFVLPSHHENFGIAAVEAMGAGLPAVISDGVALADEIEAAGAGVRFPAGDARALAGALRKILDAGVRIRAGERARRLVEERFSIESMGNGLVDMYRAAITTTSDAPGTSGPAR